MLTRPASASPRAPEQEVEVGQRQRRRAPDGGAQIRKQRASASLAYGVAEEPKAVPGLLGDVLDAGPIARRQALGTRRVAPAGAVGRERLVGDRAIGRSRRPPSRVGISEAG